MDKCDICYNNRRLIDLHPPSNHKICIKCYKSLIKKICPFCRKSIIIINNNTQLLYLYIIIIVLCIIICKYYIFQIITNHVYIILPTMILLEVLVYSLSILSIASIFYDI